MDIRIRISLLEIAKSAPWALELESAPRAALKGTIWKNVFTNSPLVKRFFQLFFAPQAST